MDAFWASNDDDEEVTHEHIISSVANFTMQMVAGALKIVAERDVKNTASRELPSVLLIDIVLWEITVVHCIFAAPKDPTLANIFRQQDRKIDK